ncbi:MAG TPA: hypothetical protein VE650_17465, partial [Acetobacteraceae bacterium]|nr:hypothetical protein [Acetobacteraceae bacterium]
MGSLVKLLLTFSTSIPIERVHPLQGGILRLKHPTERRPGLTQPHPWRFWPAFAWETARNHAAILRALVSLVLAMRAVKRDKAAAAYTDIALTWGEPEDEAKLELLAPAVAKQKAAA